MGVRGNSFSPDRLAQQATRQVKGAAFSFLLGRVPLKRVSLSNLTVAGGETVKVQFNPTTLRERVTVRYTRNKIRGLPHEPLDYENTSNWIITTEFYVDEGKRSGAIPVISSFQRFGVQDFRRFLMAACYPPRGARGPGLADASPPVILFKWPKTLTFEGVITELEFEHVRFDWKDSGSTTLMARVVWEEVRAFRLTSEGVRRDGDFRPGSTLLAIAERLEREAGLV